MDDIRELIRKIAAINALEHDGKADAKAVIGKIVSARPDLKGNIKEIIPIVNEIVNEINSIGIEEIKKIGVLEKEKQEKNEEKTLPPLPDVKGKVIMRMAPSPSGPLHIGHSRMAILNDEYVKMYDGINILRIEDTNPGNVELEAYDMIKEDLEWLGVKVDKIVIQTDRFDVYYKYAKTLLEMGKAYITLCDEKEWRSLKAKQKPCPDRDIDPSIHLERWEKMLSGEYEERQAVYVIKTDLSHPNPAIRDWAAFRIIKKPKHPRTGDKFIVYPLMNFSVAIDDHDLNLTHIIRGKDHLNNTYRQLYIYEYLNWPKPVFIHYGKVKIENSILKTSIIKKGIRNGEYSGWDDVRLGTLKALKRRGIRPESIRKYWIDVGLKDVDIIFSWELLYSYNRKIIDPLTKRYFFVSDPVEFSLIANGDLKARIPLHPSIKEYGFREYSVKNGDKIMITKKDYEDVKNSVFRLKDFGNFKIEDNKLIFINNDTSNLKNMKIIHWVPGNSIKCRVYKPDGKIEEGYAEPLSINDVNNVVQFERFGFVKLEKNDILMGYYTHS
ncbi:MAG: glutamate--tRNA ligase [Thermoplasmata archaeon]